MNLPSNWALPTEIKNRIGLQAAGKQRAMFHNEHLLIVLHKLPDEDNLKRQAILFWRDNKAKWQASSGHQGILFLRKHVLDYLKATENLDDAYEKAQNSTAYFKLLEQLTPLKRATTDMCAALQAAREAVPEDREIIDLRDQAQTLCQTLELLYSDTRNALDFAIARRAEDQAKLGEESLKSSRRLNILAALTLPMTAISSLFGMNLKSGIESLPVIAFWILLFVSVFFGMLLTLWVLRAEKK